MTATIKAFSVQLRDHDSNPANHHWHIQNLDADETLHVQTCSEDGNEPEFILVDRHELTLDLCEWIGERRYSSDPQKSSDLHLMYKDLKKLMAVEDEFIFSSTFTNEYVIGSLNPELFNEKCIALFDWYGEFKGADE